jgi:AbrB family looped-hinge helix DNA binding protein
VRERRWSVITRVKVNSKHQIALPTAARGRLDIDAGDRFHVEVRDGVIMLVPKPTDPVEEYRGLGREIWERVDAQEDVGGERNG